MSTPRSRAHDRLLAKLPARTHSWQPPPPARQTGRPIGNKPHHRREQIRRLLAAGVSSRDMAVRVGISLVAVYRHLRAIRSERSKT